MTDQATTSTTYTYERMTYTDGSPSLGVTSTDLRAEVNALADTDTRMEAYSVTLYGDNGYGELVPLAQRAEVLYVPEANRIGIAWGADADWLDADSIEGGIARWLAPDEED